MTRFALQLFLACFASLSATPTGLHWSEANAAFWRKGKKQRTRKQEKKNSTKDGNSRRRKRPASDSKTSQEGSRLATTRKKKTTPYDKGIQKDRQRVERGDARGLFLQVASRESIGGNAGKSRAAVNMVIDRNTGSVQYIGNQGTRFRVLQGNPKNLVECTAVISIDMQQIVKLARQGKTPSSTWKFEHVDDRGNKLSRRARRTIERTVRGYLE